MGGLVVSALVQWLVVVRTAQLHLIALQPTLELETLQYIPTPTKQGRQPLQILLCCLSCWDVGGCRVQDSRLGGVDCGCSRLSDYSMQGVQQTQLCILMPPLPPN